MYALPVTIAKLKRSLVIFPVFMFVSIATVSSQEASGLSLGKPLENIRKPGDVYLAGNKGDWTIRCITETNGKPDKCEIQQLLFFFFFTPVAEISLFKLPAGEIAIAAANVMVPLETLLTNKFRFAFSKEIVKEFPYSFCNKNGCLVRMGLLEEDIEAMKIGANSEISITHVANPESTINLTLSLNGFTAAFETLKPF